jgi:hypothetical protein
MAKKIQTIRMYPEDAHKLKVWAAEANKPVGDVIRDLVTFVDQKAAERKQKLSAAGPTSYMHQPTLNLALMAESTVQSLLGKADKLSKPTGYGWEPMDDEEW